MEQVTSHTDVDLIYTIPSPYQEKLFECVSNLDGIDLEVYYCAESHSDRDWEIDLGDYKHKFLSEYFPVDKKHLNPTIVYEILSRNPDVLMVNGYAHPTMQIGIVVACILDIPLVLWSESHLRDWRNNNPDTVTKIKQNLLPKLLKRTDAFFVPGNIQKEYLLEYGASKDSIFIGSHACNIEFFSEPLSQSNSQFDHKIFNKGNVFLYVGRLIEGKGLFDLVTSFSSLSSKYDDIGLVIAGSGPLEQSLKEYVKEKNLSSVHFPGFIPRQSLPELYNMSDVFVFPSTGDTWGVVINEAMSSGLPIITTNAVGSAYDLVSDGINGYVVSPGDPIELGSAMDLILNADIKSLGANSRQIISEWTHEKAAISFENSVEHAINKH